MKDGQHVIFNINAWWVWIHVHQTRGRTSTFLQLILMLLILMHLLGRSFSTLLRWTAMTICATSLNVGLGIWVYRTGPIWLNTDLGKVLPTIIGNVANFMNLPLISRVMIFYRPKNTIKWKRWVILGRCCLCDRTSPWLTLHFQPKHIRGGKVLFLNPLSPHVLFLYHDLFVYNALWKNKAKFVVALPAEKNGVILEKTLSDSFVEA